MAHLRIASPYSAWSLLSIFASPANTHGCRSMEPPRDTTLSRQFTVIGFCLCAEAVAAGSVLTYSFDMVQNLKGSSYAAFYTSLLLSTCTLAEACAALYWIPLSKRFGTKPMLLFGLTGLASSSVLLGVAPNYWLALAARALGGLFNGNAAMISVMMQEMTQPPQHDSVKPAVPSSIWVFGQLVGCLLGGYTVYMYPAQQHPKSFNNGIFARHPYLCPNLITVCLLVTAMVQSYLLFEESGRQVSLDGECNVGEQAMVVEAPATRTIGPEHHEWSKSSHACNTNDDQHTEKSHLVVYGSHYSTMSKTSDQENAIKIASPGAAAVTVRDNTKHSDVPHPALDRAFRKKEALWMAALFLLTFHETACTSLTPTFLLDKAQSTRPQLGFRGGLGMNLPQVGSFLALGSLVGLVLQTFVFPACNRRFSTWSVVTIATFTSPLVYWLVPFASVLSNAGIGISIVLSLQRSVTTFSQSGQLVLIEDAVASGDLRSTHGMLTSTRFIARSIAPVFAGVVYDLFGSAAAWWVVALVATLAVTEFGFICTLKTARLLRVGKAMPLAATEKV